MRVIHYKEVIKEAAEELLKIERSQTKAKLRDRVRFIRCLKEGTAFTQEQAGEIVGLKRRKSQLLWKQYINKGLNSLLETHNKGSQPKLTYVQQARLLQRLDSDDICTQGQIIDWLKQEMQVSYSQPGISVLLSSIKVKLKTGRPVNVRRDEAGAQEFKKKCLNS